MQASTLFTAGHGTRPIGDLIELLRGAGVATLADVRRFPSSRRNPQYNADAFREALAGAGIEYLHVPELGGRRTGEPGEERFPCIREPAFRSYAARMARSEWQAALAGVLARPAPCVLCAETVWWRCHRRLIADLVTARGWSVVHLLAPGRRAPHRLLDGAEAREGALFLCGEPVV